MARHNELHDRVADIAGESFMHRYVRNYHLIFAGPAVQSPKDQYARTTPSLSKHNSEATDHNDSLLICDL